MKYFWNYCFASLALMLLKPATSRAELQVIENYEEQNGLTLFRMTVTAAPEPTPALKHRLCLRAHEYRPGNAATYYLRANGEDILSSTWKGVHSKHGDKVYEWYDIDDVPLNELPLDRMREAAAAFDHLVTSFIRPASEMQDCDYGYHFAELRGEEVYSLPLPGAQQSRSIARLLALRTRLATAEGRYDDAIDHMRMLYRLAQNSGNEPIFVCGLVGIAEQGVANSQAIDFIAAPNSPNLYWALSELPRPLIDLREAISLEMSAVSRVFPILLDAETAEHIPAEWARLISREIGTAEALGSEMTVQKVFKKLSDNPELSRGLTATGLALASYPAAKKRLIDSGMETEIVEEMPVGKVLAIDTAREYQRIADASEKWWYLPYKQARYRMDQTEDELLEGVRLQTGFAPQLANLLMPAVKAARNAQARIGWQTDALRVVEALRMHAAETGELPSSLDQVQIVPVPLNPITTEPYVYQLKGKTAVLDLPFSDGVIGQSWRFEITLAEP